MDRLVSGNVLLVFFFVTHLSIVLLVRCVALPHVEPMSYLQILIPSESAQGFVSEIGHQGILQFVDVRRRLLTWY